MKFSVKERKQKRAKRTRYRIRNQGDVLRLCVTCSLQHISAQIIKHGIGGDSDSVVASASTQEKELRAECKATGNVGAASLVGKFVAERALKAGIKTLAFDRSGKRYHGRVKALAEAARTAGINF